MRNKFGSRLLKAGLLNVKAASTAVLILIAPIASSGQQESSRRPELGLEISLADSSRPVVRLGGPRGGGGGMLIRRESLKINDPGAAGYFTAIDLQSVVEDGGMRVTLFLVYNDISVQEWWKDKKEKLAGSYLIHDGETARPAELAEFGIEPFEMRVIGANPIVLKPGEGPRIINKTTAIEVEKLERHIDSYSLWLKNTSSKDIVAYTVSYGGGSSSTRGRGMTELVLGAGKILDETLMPVSDIERSGITISLAVFSDGTFEGDSKYGTKFLAKGQGIGIQAPHVLHMIEQTLKVDDSDLRSSFDKLEADLWVIPESMYKAVAIQFLRTKFPREDESSLNALYEDFKGGLYDARNIALSSIGETRRSVDDLEQRGQFGSAVELIRRTLERLRETLGKIAATPR